MQSVTDFTLGRFRKRFQASEVQKESLSVYQCFVPETNKQGGLGTAFVNTPPKFLGLPWKFWKNRSSLQV